MADTRAVLAADERVSAVDLAFADFLQSQATQPSDALYTGAVLASAAVQHGDVCCALAIAVDHHPLVGVNGLVGWRDALLQSGVVQAASEPVRMPLVLDAADRLYLARYWRDETRLAEALRSRMGRVVDPEPPPRTLLDTLFPPNRSTDAGPVADWQRVAAVVAARQSLSVITGGPGTGKTRTVARLLAVLGARHGTPPAVALAAPTGKAAARLLESLRTEAASLDAAGLPAGLPSDASTVHRLLGYRHGRRGFRHNADNPVPADVVLVDEASMIDLSLMAQLVDALHPDTRLILIGDRDQLASVEAGNVLGDIVGDAHPTAYSEPLRRALQASCAGFDTPVASPPSTDGGIADAVVALTQSYRFDARAGIGALARSVNAGDADAAVAALADGAQAETALTTPEQAAVAEHVVSRTLAELAGVIAARSPTEALDALSGFRVLCALRTGARGVDSLNAAVEQALARRGLIGSDALWYRGRPILVTRNAPGLGLYNGDTGVIWPDENGVPMAWFAEEGGVRGVAPGRLPAHQTCYAMTVHKSQGSEFGRVLIVLPEPPHTVLSRDLVYTAVTRARHAVEVYGSEAAVRDGCQTDRVRVSGLRHALWGT